MKASEWRQTLGSMATTAQDAIVAALTDPNMLVPIEWVGIPISGGGHDAILYVGCDSLKVGEPDDCVRVNVSMSAHQQVCDALGLQMLSEAITRQGQDPGWNVQQANTWLAGGAEVGLGTPDFANIELAEEALT